MAFAISNEEIGPRDPALAWADNGPGLYSDESLVQLDSGELVAVSVEMKWPDNNTGLGLHGWARWINPDGSSKTCPEGRSIETSISFTADADTLRRHTKAQLSREVLLAVLGEPATPVPIEHDAEAPPPPAPENLPAGTTLNPEATERDLIPWPQTERDNASIRTAIDHVKAAQNGIDAAAVLGI